MTLILITFGIMIATAGVVLLIAPALLWNFLEQNKGKPWILALAIGVRIILGLLLILSASESRFPLVIQVLGWVAIAAAVILAMMGKTRFEKLMEWVLRSVKPFARIGGLVAIAFGYFIAYAFLS